MDSTTLIIVALIGLWAVIVIVSGLMMLSRRRVAAPEIALWPPTYFFPDWATDDAPRTQEIPVAKMSHSPHSGIPVTAATNPQTPPDWRRNAENAPDLTMAEGMAAVDPTSLKPATPDSSPTQASPASQAPSPYFDEEDTSKIPNLPRGIRVDSLTNKIAYTRDDSKKDDPKKAKDAKAGDQPPDEQKPKQ
jgi:hypothetical protein